MSEFDIQLVTASIPLGQLAKMAEEGFGELVKAVVDVDQHVMAIGGELHADEEQFLIERGSLQANLWGINLYPGLHGTNDFIEFDSMINVRPSVGNRSRSVGDAGTREAIVAIVGQLVSTDDD